MKNLRASPSAALTFLRDLLPTITSPVFSDIVIVLQGGTGYDTRPTEHVVVNVVWGAYEVKPFRLVFVWRFGKAIWSTFRGS